MDNHHYTGAHPRSWALARIRMHPIPRAHVGLLIVWVLLSR